MGSGKTLAKLIEIERTAEKNTVQETKSFGSSDKTENPKQRKRLSRKKIEQLILEHRDHGRRLAWSFLSSWRIRMTQDEVMSVVGMALCEAANRFDVSKGVAFKTFFFYHLRGMLLKEIAKLIQEQKVLQAVPHSAASSFSDAEQFFLSRGAFSLVENNNPERIIQKRQIANVCWESCAQLDPLEQEVIVRYFVYDEPLINIAKELDYCRCHISRVKSRALVKLGKLIRDCLQEDGQGQASETDRNLVNMPLGGDTRRKKNYTGGRGRRRHYGVTRKSEALNKLLKQA